MIRNKIAKFAKETENKISSFKINRKICIVLATVITVASIGISSNKLNNTSTNVLALSDSNITLNDVGAPIPTASTALANSLDTNYNKNSFCKVTIIKHGKEQNIIIRKNTVKKALDFSHTVLGSFDVVNCRLSDMIYDGMKIVIDEVKYKNETKTEKITLNEFKKSYPDEPYNKLDKNGKVLVNKTVSVKYVNGERTTETLKSISYKSVDIKKPITKKKTVSVKYASSNVKSANKTSLKSSKNKSGYKMYSSLKTISELTPSKDFKLDKNGIPVNYKKKITGTASAYSCGTHTATGKRVKPGYIAVNPRQIPYGTKLFIRSADGNYVYGYASAEDTGGFVAWGNTVADLFFWSESTCNQFGRRAIEIYVLN